MQYTDTREQTVPKLAKPGLVGVEAVSPRAQGAGPLSDDSRSEGVRIVQVARDGMIVHVPRTTR